MTPVRGGGEVGAGRCTLVIPCYNEAARLDCAAILSYMSGKSGETTRLLFVDDGSTDGTQGVLQSLVEGAPGRITMLRLDRNQGKAEAVRVGMIAAMAQGATYVGFWDADLATPLEAVDDFLNVFQAQPHLDWVIGSRLQALGRRIDRRATRHYMGRIFATAASSLLGLPVYDTQCGAKLFRTTEEFERLLERPFLSRWYFDVELFARLAVARNGRRPGVEEAVYEVSLRSWTDVPDSRMRLRDLFRVGVDLTRIWLRYHPRRAVRP